MPEHSIIAVTRTATFIRNIAGTSHHNVRAALVRAMQGQHDRRGPTTADPDCITANGLPLWA